VLELREQPLGDVDLGVGHDPTLTQTTSPGRTNTLRDPLAGETTAVR